MTVDKTPVDTNRTVDKMDKKDALAVCRAMAALIGVRLPRSALRHIAEHHDDWFAQASPHTVEWDASVLAIGIGRSERHNAYGEQWKWVLQRIGDGKPRLTTNTA